MKELRIVTRDRIFTLLLLTYANELKCDPSSPLVKHYRDDLLNFNFTYYEGEAYTKNWNIIHSKVKTILDFYNGVK